ncbi:MAG: hypothetical protein R3E79_27100 [Caldilineaceae bacterium]
MSDHSPLATRHPPLLAIPYDKRYNGPYTPPLSLWRYSTAH